MKNQNVTKHRIKIGNKRVYYLDYIKAISTQLPQWENVNHVNIMKKIYNKAGMKGLNKYIKIQYYNYRKTLRTTQGSKWKIIIWTWLYEILL